jgi:hypothetical protein
VTLSATGEAQVKRTRMGDGHSARTFLGKAGREAAKVQRVWVLTLSALDVNPGCKESVRDWLIRVVHTSGLLDGKRAAVVVSADMGIGAHVREVLADTKHVEYMPEFQQVIFVHGYLHEHMHMLKAWRGLAGCTTTQAFAPIFGRSTPHACEALADGATTHHDNLHSFHLEREGVLKELATEWLEREGAPPLADVPDDSGAELLAWLRERARHEPRIAYILKVVVELGGAVTLFLGGVRECDGLAVRAARAAFSWAWLITNHPVYAEQVAHAILQYRCMPQCWRDFVDSTVGVCEPDTQKGLAQAFDAIMEQVCRRIKRLVSHGASYQNWLAVSRGLDSLLMIRRRVFASIGKAVQRRLPRSQVSTAQATFDWRVMLRTSAYFAPPSAGAPPPALVGVDGAPLQPDAVAIVSTTGPASFRTLFDATCARKMAEWKKPGRVYVNPRHLKQDTAATEKRKARMQRPREELEAELEAMDAELERLRAGGQYPSDGEHEDGKSGSDAGSEPEDE